MTVVTEVTQYTVKVETSAEWDLFEGWHWWLQVSKTAVAEDVWRVSHLGKVLADSGLWVFAESSEDRDNDEYLRHHRFGVDEALARAREAAPLVKVNGATATEVFERWRKM